MNSNAASDIVLPIADEERDRSGVLSFKQAKIIGLYLHGLGSADIASQLGLGSAAMSTDTLDQILQKPSLPHGRASAGKQYS